MSEKMPDVSKQRPAEFEFHQKRWENAAEVRAKRGVLKMIWDRNTANTPSAHMFARAESSEDFMRAEAHRDNEAVDKTRKHEVVDGVLKVKMDAEYEMWQKNLKIVIDHIKGKRKNPESSEYRPLLLILGGGMKGPYSAGQVLGLHEAGIPPELFKYIVGISAGAGSATYYVAGAEQTRKGASLFYEECTTPAFLSLRRLRKMMDVAALTTGGWMFKGPKKLDEDAVRKCPAELYYGVTRPIRAEEEPQEEFINAKTAEPGMLNAMQASMSVPIFSGEVPPVNGIEYNDGAFDPMPIEAIIKKFNPTDILILPNTPFDRLDTFQLSKTERFVAELSKGLGMRGSMLSLGQVEKFMLIKEQLRKSMEFIEKQTGVHIGIMWPPDSGLTTTGQNPDDIKAAVSESARGVISAFNMEQPQDLRLYETEKLAA